MKKVFILGLLMVLLVSVVLAQESRGDTQVGRPLERESTTDNIANSPLLWVSIILTGYFLFTFKTQSKTKKKVIGLLVVGLWVGTFSVNVLLAQEPTTNFQEPSTDWEQDYQTSLSSYQSLSSHQLESGDEYVSSFVEDPAANPLSYLSETDKFDYSNLQPLINSIKSQADSADEAIQLTLDWVYNNIHYVKGEPDNRCFDLSASELVEQKNQGGQCDTQSRVVITLLRGMGIAARPVGGCITRNPSCNFQFALMALAGKEIRKPQYEPLTESDLGIETTSRKGGLHLWGEVWLPNEGWVTFESTSGEIVSNYCWKYMVELYPTDEDTRRYCVSTDRNFQLKCVKW